MTKLEAAISALEFILNQYAKIPEDNMTRVEQDIEFIARITLDKLKGE